MDLTPAPAGAPLGVASVPPAGQALQNRISQSGRSLGPFHRAHRTGDGRRRIA
jgi:hypothetical protein